jgi:hypothetical protein
MDPWTAMAIGLAGILLALAVLGLSWLSSARTPAAQDIRPATTAHASIVPGPAAPPAP